MSGIVDVLILTSELDFAADLICLELGRLGSSYLRLNRESLSELRLVLDPLAPRLRCIFEGREWVVDGSLRSVWWRVGTFDRSSADRSMDVVTQLQRSQWGAFLRSMMVFDSARWMNHPAATYSAETKALQLRVAQALGFDVPETAMGNDHGVLAGRPAGSRVALKSIDTLLLREGDEQIFAYTTLVEPERIAVEDLHLAPVTIQASLDPKLDLRVTVVGDRLWCAEVRGGGEPIAGDWRLTPKSDLTYPAHDLPSHIADRCLALVSRLRLHFGAIDLALCDGRYHFIEINPTGEWGWLEAPDRQIAAAIAEELAEGAS